MARQAQNNPWHGFRVILQNLEATESGQKIRTLQNPDASKSGRIKIQNFSISLDEIQTKSG